MEHNVWLITDGYIEYKAHHSRHLTKTTQLVPTLVSKASEYIAEYAKHSQYNI